MRGSGESSDADGDLIDPGKGPNLGAWSLDAPHQSRAQATRAQASGSSAHRCGSGQRRKNVRAADRRFTLVNSSRSQCSRYAASRSTPPRWPRRPVLKGLNVCDDRRDGRPDNQNPNRNRDGRGDQRHRVQFHFHDSPPQYGSWPYSGQYNPTAAITSAAIAAA